MALALAGCGGAEPSSSSEDDESTPSENTDMSWEEFKANAHRDQDRGLYTIDGFERRLNDVELRAVYERYVQTGALVVNGQR
ncbi:MULTISPECIES: hypothetical protein [Sorangium]|uniref:Uncharacterized protein n=1 Tax=Sorangium cellulosum TaxID=56 RepID=A0A4P2R4S2_SORCE|nr:MULTISPECIES: hypothetical protein [Sorangium]AUX37003.1 hypothetical protein SOCE836_092220 [Sorangium cellulosum]WCQ96296.1 hypothetical protein NQZ70_09081 [Sorangium sp. Soce836]